MGFRLIFDFHQNSIIFFQDISFLSNISGNNFLKLFNLPILEKFIFSSPTNPINNHHIIYFSLASYNYLTLLDKCIESILFHGISSNQLIIFSLDEKTKDFCAEKHIQTFLLNITEFYEMKHLEILRIKQIIQYFFLCYNSDVLIFDNDIIFCQNFQQELIEKFNDDVDIQITDEKMYPRKYSELESREFFNTGFLFARSSVGTKKLFRKWIHDGFIRKKPKKHFSENQKRLNYIIANFADVISRDEKKQILVYRFYFDDEFNLTFHVLSPIKYIIFCSFRDNFTITSYTKAKRKQTLNFANEMNLIYPNIIHMACVYSKTKDLLINNIKKLNISYDYLLNNIMNALPS